jgi:hypothetical protein
MTLLLNFLPQTSKPFDSNHFARFRHLPLSMNKRNRCKLSGPFILTLSRQ